MKEARPKRVYMFYDSVYMTLKGQCIYSDRKQSVVAQGHRRGGGQSAAQEKQTK